MFLAETNGRVCPGGVGLTFLGRARCAQATFISTRSIEMYAQFTRVWSKGDSPGMTIESGVPHCTNEFPFTLGGFAGCFCVVFDFCNELLTRCGLLACLLELSRSTLGSAFWHKLQSASPGFMGSGFTQTSGGKMHSFD
jgi:hypothetical protein